MVGGPRLRSLTLVVLVLSMVLAGCSSLQDGDGTPDLPDGDAAVDAFRSTEDVRGTVTVEQRRPNGSTASYAHRLDRRPGTGMFRMRYTSPTAASGRTLVTNGTVVWVYRPTNGTYRQNVRANPTPDEQRERFLRSVFDRLSDDSTMSDDRSIQVSPLPVVPSVETDSMPVPRRLDVSYGGRATVSGRTAHVVTLNLPDDGATGRVRNQTIWFDAERFVVLKTRTVTRGAERGPRVTTWQLENVSFDADVAAETFRFSPPEDARLVDPQNIDTRQFHSLDALRAGTSLSVPRPSVPDRYSFHLGTVVENGEGTRVWLYYQDRYSMLAVAKSSIHTDAPSDAGKPVSVDDATGRLQTEGTLVEVVWSCEGRQFAVQGQLSTDRMTAIAESVGCE